MTYKKLRMPRADATEILLALGSLKDAIEFEDLTKNNKNFADMIRRCEEMTKKIDEYACVCYNFNMPYKQYLSFEEFNEDLNNDIKERDKKFGSTYFDLLENEILENDRRINELIDSHSQIKDDLVSLIEKKYVFKIAANIVKKNIAYGDFSDTDANDDGIKQSSTSNLNFILGVVSTDLEFKMKRVIYRVSRGHAITRFYDFNINGEEYLITSSMRERDYSTVNKNSEALIKNPDKKIFTVIFTGGEENILLKKIVKICDYFQANRYPVPRNYEINNEVDKISKEITDKKILLFTIEKTLKDLILSSNRYKNKIGIKYSLYRLYFEQEKLIHNTLNKCLIRDSFIDAQVWVPKSHVTEVENIIKNLFSGKENKLNASIEDIEMDESTIPPSHIPLNSFSEVFQLVVDTYGIPHYREINPGYFTIVTFPFLFGVMFGDIGHGAVLLIFGIYLCLNNEKLTRNNSVLKPALFARYFILLMGFFGVFCGLLYNDFLSIPLYFTSCYPRKGNIGDSINKEENCSHSFGLDPIWLASSNELMFVNSLKMKLSVILGVAHMTLGIFLKGLNAFFEGDCVEFIFVFIPQLILMSILFGYMDILIFIKWSVNYKGKEHLAPDIKSYLMNIVLKLGKLPDPPTENKNEDWILIGERETIQKIHLIILILSVICIITMLLPKVIIQYTRAKKKFKLGDTSAVGGIGIEDEITDDIIQSIQDVQPPGISDFLVGSVIETIEFVLGTISNTASYLRLWALSLAHSQLSLVFFSKILGLCGTASENAIIDGILLSIGYIIFAFITIGVLLFMDMMECFLHTLRLHWVEFQNKFYKADGYKFTPFCFSQSLKLDNDDYKELIKSKTKFIGNIRKS